MKGDEEEEVEKEVEVVEEEEGEEGEGNPRKRGRSVPTTPSQVQVVHVVLEGDILMVPEEDATGPVIAAQLGTDVTCRQVKKSGTVWQQAISAQLGAEFADQQKSCLCRSKKSKIS